jgi:ureidoglycolate dehydrogenase (NAD+)
MSQVQVPAVAISAAKLARLGTDLLCAHGLLTADAELVTDTLVESNLRGIDSHGIARLPHYLKRLQGGSIHPRPQMTLEDLGPATARLDANHALGQLAMNRATDEAIRLARNSGAGWVAVNNSSHCGALAYYGLRMANAGMLGLAFTHVDPMVLPFGARAPFCGTNPLCICAPRSSRGGDRLATGALCLDMATSVTPWNSVANAAQENVPIPLGWAVDGNGNDTQQADQVTALYPFGEYKGSGLGLMIDVLCSMLSNSPYGPDIPKMYGDYSQHRRLGGLVGAIDISRFVPLEHFHARVDEMITRWNALTPAQPGGRVQFPGEPELRERERRLAEGISIGVNLLDELNTLAGQFNVTPLNANGLMIDRHEKPTGPHGKTIDRAARPTLPQAT